MAILTDHSEGLCHLQLQQHQPGDHVLLALPPAGRHVPDGAAVYLAGAELLLLVPLCDVHSEPEVSLGR